MFQKNTLIGLAVSILISIGLCYLSEAIRPDVPEKVVLSSEGIAYRSVQAPKAASEDGVVSAEEWREIYPDIVASMEANTDNNYRISYIEEDPYITNLYEGYGFAKDYTSAIGHTYCLEDVHNTERPHPLANCLTCKTPNFTKMVNDLGEEVYMYDFEETWGKMSENTSCYNCHANEAGNGGQLVATHQYIVTALGDAMDTIDPAVVSCGQCHIEYYFNVDTKATTSPIQGSVESMHPTAMLEYYNEMGFTDWVQESTGTNMLKTQHPEMETFLQGVHASFLNCADCHMALTEGEDGTMYHSHKWVSPLEDQALLDSCVQCHGDTDMAEKIHAIQEEITARENEVGLKLSDLKDALAAAVAEGSMSEDELNEIRQLYRNAQWYWDYSYVENSEGAHNSSLDRECLDTAESIVDEAMGKLNA